MSELDKYLKLARTAREEDNTEDAKRYYDMVRTEDPENGEAKFFYTYYALYEGKNGEIPKRFSNLCTVLKSAIKMVMETENSTEEKLKDCHTILNHFVPVTWTLNSYMNKKNHETKIGNSHVQVFGYSQIAGVSKEGMKNLKDIGDYLETIFASSPEGMKLATMAWKEYVTLAQKWCSWAPKGEAEIYAAKIQKVEPDYVIPKKACCVSFGSKR